MLRPGRLPHQPGPLLGPSTVMRLKTRSSAGEQRLRSRSHVAAGRLGRRVVSCEVWHPQQRPARGAAPHQRCWRQRLGGHRGWPGASAGQVLHLHCRALARLSSLSRWPRTWGTTVDVAAQCRSIGWRSPRWSPTETGTTTSGRELRAVGRNHTEHRRVYAERFDVTYPNGMRYDCEAFCERTFASWGSLRLCSSTRARAPDVPALRAESTSLRRETTATAILSGVGATSSTWTCPSKVPGWTSSPRTCG